MGCLHAALVAMALSGTGQASQTGQTVLLDFYADWCGPCHQMDPTVQQLIAKKYPVRRVNIDHEPALARQFGIQTIPCFVMLVEGREVGRTGPTDLTGLERLCKSAGAAPPGRPGILGALAGKGGKSAPVPVARPKQDPFASRAPAAPLASAVPAHNALPGRQILPVSYTPTTAPATAGDANLIAASVRIRVEDADGHSCGSGTIIDAREGQLLILTCGHIFRDSQGKGRIEVDLFGPSPVSRVPGRLITYDLKRDVGLLTIRAPGPVAVARVAPAGYRPVPNAAVASVGCNNGDAPTVARSHVVAVDRCLGPPNIQVAGQPVEGRSGGGLFSADGLVIGVCNAADHEQREGFFAGLGSIHAALDETGLAYIYQPNKVPSPRTALVATAPLPAAPSTTPRVRLPSPVADSPVRPAPAELSDTAPLPAGEQAAMDEIRRRVKEGAEVVCVIRNSRDPQAKTEVLMLDKVSPGFLKGLAAESRTSGKQETSLEVPRPRKTLLEWDAETGWRHREPISMH